MILISVIRSRLEHGMHVTEDSRGAWHVVAVAGRADSSTAESLKTFCVGRLRPTRKWRSTTPRSITSPAPGWERSSRGRAPLIAPGSPGAKLLPRSRARAELDRVRFRITAPKAPHHSGPRLLLLHSWIPDPKLFQVALVLAWIIVLLPQLRTKFLHLFSVELNGGLVTRAHQRDILRLFDLYLK
jgi:hypothetical protein